MSNPLVDVQKHGQSIWYDNISRGLITSGQLQAMVEQDGLLGVTSNPAIFEKAITGSSDYDPALRARVRQQAGDAETVFELMAIEDIQFAADVLRSAYIATDRRDGYVSLEVSPHLAHDTDTTCSEARRLWAAVGRENVMIKVPATPEGLPAIESLIADGINVNVTLLFAVEAYADVAQAYIAGLERFAAAGGDVSRVASVASFFVSRIDSMVDDLVDQSLGQTEDADRRAKLEQLKGRVAIANAKLAYAHYLKVIESDRWKALAGQGAMPQRVLWASTGTKNPSYPKTLYVDSLIAKDTVNTVPGDTFTAFKEGGRVTPGLMEHWPEQLEEARGTLSLLAEMGISLKEVTDRLLADGVKKFADPFDKLITAVETQRREVLGDELASQTLALGAGSEPAEAVVKEWSEGRKARRMWLRDAGIWTGSDEARWLGWLDVASIWREQEARVAIIRDDVHQTGFDHVVLMGMGGSSLCPDLLARTFGRQPGFPELLVLDSTVPAQVRTVESKIDPARTLFIVPSKSGSTIEPNMFKQYFFARVAEKVGPERAAAHFVAITDPGTKLDQLAAEERFRHVAHGEPTIGGRFSALSNFGLVPGAVMGVNVSDLMRRAKIMIDSCAKCVPSDQNPGVQLGLALGTLANAGRDKLTIVASPGIATLGAWLEQLVAESTGKHGVGIVPVADEAIGPPSVYGADRVFAYVRLRDGADGDQDAAVDALEQAGHPVVRIELAGANDIGQEFFRWEVATAVAGSVLGINPFDQPDVEAAKVKARDLMEAYEKQGRLDEGSAFLEADGLGFFADEANAKALSAGDAAGVLRAHLARLEPGDYFAINAYIEMDDASEAALQGLRHAVRDAKHVATTLGFGPRFLHSTGQLHKGGPNSGVFLQVTSDDAEDLEIPGQKFTFGVLKRAQGQGDFAVLAERGRRLLRVHLGADVAAGLSRLRDLVGQAIS